MSFSDVEDEPDKLRRNTLMLSVFTVIFNFLDLNFPKPMFGFDLPAGSDWKIWLLILIFSVYFFIRYHYSDEAERHAVNVSQAKKELPKRHRQAGVNLMFALYRRNFRRNFVAETIEQATQVAAMDGTAIPVALLLLESVEVEAYNSENSSYKPNQLGFVFIFANEPVRTYARSNYREIDWPWWFVCWVWCRVRFSLLTNPKFIVNIYIPYVLFVTALVCTAFRLWGASWLLAARWLLEL